MSPPSVSHHELDQPNTEIVGSAQPSASSPPLQPPSESQPQSQPQTQTQPHRPPPISIHSPHPYPSQSSPYPTPTTSSSINMASAAVLPPTDILTPRLPTHHMSNMYHPSASRSPAVRSAHPLEYSGGHAQQYPESHPHPDDRRPSIPRDQPGGRPREQRDNVRYEPYSSDRRRTVSGRDDKITLPPPGMGGLRLPEDPYAPRQVLPSMHPNQTAWAGAEQQARQPNRGGPLQLPSLRSISGESSPAPRNIAPLAAAAQYDRPALSPRESYRQPISPRPPYGQPTSSPHPQYDHPRHRPQGYPYPQSGPPGRKTHPPPIQTRSPPMRVKYEPDPSPPLRSAPLPVMRMSEAQFYSNSAPSRYSPTGQQGMDYGDQRRGSVISLVGDGKEPLAVGQTRRLAHLMSEQKRRESINSGFTALRAALPLALPTDSKAVILRKALARIEQLERAAGIPPLGGPLHNYTHAHQLALEAEANTPPARPDWRTAGIGAGGTMRASSRMDDRHTHSSSSSRKYREVDDGGRNVRYDEQWVDRRREVVEYEAAPGNEGEYGDPARTSVRERQISGPQRDRDSRWTHEEEEDMDGGSVYSQERARSRESVSHVR